ncbi:MAG: monovalent cation/H(+) antiporter subunit G [Methanolobus sp.]|nr:monovalent cation/H(+) antiporter subunit G [Methanolobus sp.]
MFATAINIIANAFFLIGILFVFVGMVGLLRLPDVYNRLHATTKIATLGTFGVMIAIAINTGFSEMGLKAITVGIFLLLTAPVSAHMIARAAYRHGTRLCEGSIVDEYEHFCKETDNSRTQVLNDKKG